MKLELSPTEAGLLLLLLQKELEETRVEMHHAKNIEFKSELQGREHLVNALLEHFKHLT